MSSPGIHRIRRQRWMVRAAGTADAFALRCWLRESWEGELLPAIERAFDQRLPGEEVVRVPRLEIRMVVPAGADFRARIPELLEQSVARELDALGGSGEVVDAAQRVERLTLAQDSFATLLHYLRTGTLPWAAAARHPQQIANELRVTARAELARLAPLVGHSVRGRDELFRLLQMLGGEAASSFPLLAPALPRQWEAALAALMEPDRAIGREAGHELRAPALHLRINAAAALLAEVRLHPIADDVAAIADVLRSAVGESGFASLEPLLRGSLGTGVTPLDDVLHASREPTTETPPEVTSGGERTTRTDHALSLSRFASDVTALPSSAGIDPKSFQPLLDRRSDDHPQAVVHAGLILLHPYIERLFAATSVAVSGKLPKAAQPRGAALLHYLATGREEIHELELGLIKLLLGLSPEDSLPVADGLLQPNDVEECTALLEAVIEHWRILKRTSATTLRTSFLQRAGLLGRVEQGWSLHPDPGPYDVLLHHLPWSFSVVRLSWMPEPIYSEWTAP